MVFGIIESLKKQFAPATVASESSFETQDSYRSRPTPEHMLSHEIALRASAEPPVAALKNKGIDASVHYRPYEDHEDRPTSEELLVNYRDAQGRNNRISMNYTGTVLHERFYDRTITAEIKPLDLGRDADATLEKLRAMHVDLPQILALRIHDPVTKTVVETDYQFPAPIAQRLTGVQKLNPKVSIPTLDHIENHLAVTLEGTSPKNHQRKIGYARHGEVMIQIPLDAFKGHGLETINFDNFRESPFALRVSSSVRTTIPDVIKSLGQTNTPALKP